MDKISELAYKLKLPYIKNYFTDEVDEATNLDKSHYQFLLDILEKEYELRRENGIKNKMNKAKFPYKKYLENLDREALPVEAKKRLKELETLNFIKEGQNIILIGNAGVGKTHISIGLGIKACMRNYNVLFMSVPNLITELKEKVSLNQLSVFKKRFEKYDLVILDELGYISFDKQGSELLFNLISSRNETKSTIITSNLTFDRWDEVFNDPVITAAMVDRLTHRSYIINMTGSSYRMKETNEWIKSMTLNV